MTICKAVCVVHSETGSKDILGTITLTQDDIHQPVKIMGKLAGLAPGKHGISVGTWGDLSRGAASCGPIFNPFGKTHGGPADEERMVGDLGNIVADDQGVCLVNLADPKASLLGPHSVIGRSLVVYAGEDDRGRGGHENSLTTGNAGPRVAAGVIGVAAAT